MKHFYKVILVTIVILAFCCGLYVLSDLWDAPVLRFLNYVIIGFYAGSIPVSKMDKEKYRMTPKKWILNIVMVIVGAVLLSWLFEGRLW